jgi:hypothetical protein
MDIETEKGKPKIDQFILDDKIPTYQQKNRHQRQEKLKKKHLKLKEKLKKKKMLVENTPKKKYPNLKEKLESLKLVSEEKFISNLLSFLR